MVRSLLPQPPPLPLPRADVPHRHSSTGYLLNGKCLALTEIPSGYYADQEGASLPLLPPPPAGPDLPLLHSSCRREVRRQRHVLQVSRRRLRAHLVRLARTDLLNPRSILTLSLPPSRAAARTRRRISTSSRPRARATCTAPSRGTATRRSACASRATRPRSRATRAAPLPGAPAVLPLSDEHDGTDAVCGSCSAKDSAGTQLYLTPTRKCVLSWKGPPGYYADEGASACPSFQACADERAHPQARTRSRRARTARRPVPAPTTATL